MALNKNSNKTAILLHIIGWSLFFLLSFFSIRSGRYKPPIFPQVWHWAISLVFFYICFLILIPKFLFRRKVGLFFMSAFLSMFICLTALVLINNHYFGSEKSEQNKDKLSTEPVKEEPGTANIKKWHSSKKHKKRILYGQLYVLLLIFASSVAVSLAQRWYNDERLKNQRDKEQLDAELKYLRNQVNPHFLFNSLNSIYSLANKKSDQTTEVILKLSDLLRYMLYETDNKLVPLESEITHINNYIQLQQLRITDKVQLNFKAEGNSKGYFIEPLLLIPLVENAFKFGIDNVNNSKIDIALHIENGKLIFHSENSIVQNAQKESSESGIGLKNLKRRLELSYSELYTLKISEESDKFSVLLEIKLKTT